ncbi:MAG: SAM-dependent methyltransferase [Deltaproteobacteria bacterium]|nr:SAM-dependent methyltransferase [Deltaproteobacteria bacterium]
MGAPEPPPPVRMELVPIGVARTEAGSVPRHWSASQVRGRLLIDPEHAAGLRDIRPGERIVVLFWFDRSPAFTPAHLVQRTPRAGAEKGVFSTCSPVRPNPVGMSVLRVLGVSGTAIDVEGMDMLDGTPLLDIKPHHEEA